MGWMAQVILSTTIAQALLSLITLKEDLNQINGIILAIF
jgi:hypothetical protein